MSTATVCKFMIVLGCIISAHFQIKIKAVHVGSAHAAVEVVCPSPSIL